MVMHVYDDTNVAAVHESDKNIMKLGQFEHCS